MGQGMAREVTPIGRFLEDRRLTARPPISREAFAVELGIASATLNALIHGTRPVRPITLARLAQRLGVEVDTLNALVEGSL